MLSDLIPFGEAIALGLGLTSVGAAMIVQCADKKNKKGKGHKGPKVAPKKASIRSAKSSKKSVSQKLAPGSQMKQLDTSKKSSRGPQVSIKSKKLVQGPPSLKSKKSERSQKKLASSRSGSKRSYKDSASVKSLKTAREKTSDRLPELTARPSQTDNKTSLESFWATKPSEKQAKQFEAAQPVRPVELQMEPRELRFGKQGGFLKVQLHNPSAVRQAVKVKCSDNDLYRVNPVYGYVEPGQLLNIEVARQQTGKSKLDKLVFVTAKATGDKDLKQIFKDAPATEQQVMVMPLYA